MPELDNTHSPLGVVQHELWRNTDRNPSDATAVMDMINEAVDSLGDQAVPFTDAVMRSLDPHAPGGLGVENAMLFDSFSELVEDNEAERVRQWGALSFLGALATTHNPQLEEASDFNTSLHRAQLPSYLARQSLQQIQETEHIKDEYRVVARAFLSHVGIPSEDAAIELEMHGFRRDILSEAEPTTSEDNLAKDTASELAMCGSSMGEPRDVELASLNDNVDAKLDAMDWLKGADLSSVVGRDVFHDGKKVALIVDLASAHNKLRALKEEIECDLKQGRQFWGQLATAVVHFVNTGRAQQVRNAKVSTYYWSNKTHHNESVSRAYYAPLGNDPTDNTPILGLVAAYRTKDHQSSVLSILA